MLLSSYDGIAQPYFKWLGALCLDRNKSWKTGSDTLHWPPVRYSYCSERVVTHIIVYIYCISTVVSANRN